MRPLLRLLPSKPFRPAHCVALVPNKAWRLFHWASPTPCCHSKPSHSQFTSPMTEGAFAGSQSYHGTHGQTCSARPFPNWLLQLETLYCHHAPLLHVKPLPVAKTQSSQTLPLALQASKGKSSSASENQTTPDKLRYRDKIRISFVQCKKFHRFVTGVKLLYGPPETIMDSREKKLQQWTLAIQDAINNPGDKSHLAPRRHSLLEKVVTRNRFKSAKCLQAIHKVEQQHYSKIDIYCLKTLKGVKIAFIFSMFKTPDTQL